MKNPNHTTLAQNMWRQVLAGRVTAREQIEAFSWCSPDEKLLKQIDSMPDDMLTALEEYVRPIGFDESGYQWPPEVLGVSLQLLRAFQDFDAAEAWRRRQIKLIWDAVQQRRRREQVELGM